MLSCLPSTVPRPRRFVWVAITLTTTPGGWVAITTVSKRLGMTPESLNGSREMWAHPNRQGIQVARCTTERLMADHGWPGGCRRRKVRTTVPDPDHPRPPDLLDRQFGAEGDQAGRRLSATSRSSGRRHPPPWRRWVPTSWLGAKSSAWPSHWLLRPRCRSRRGGRPHRRSRCRRSPVP